MSFIISIVTVLWAFRIIKNVLFWVYLWQLKEYHLGRFLDHFQTHRGKHLVFNPSNAIKIVLIRFLFVFTQANILVLITYSLEGVKMAYDVLRGVITRPVFTSKTLMLLLLSGGTIIAIAGSLFFFVGLRGNMFFVSLVLIDIISPLIISAVVLLFQPITVLQRNRMIQQAREKRKEMQGLRVVGITGSYGKSSTKELLFHILKSKYNVIKTQANNNSEIGISQTILRDLTKEHEIFVCEMGAYNRGGIRLLTSIVKPQIGVVTGVNEQHMATFGSQENTIAGKYELIESLGEEGVGIFNGFNSYTKEMYEKTNTEKRRTGEGGDLWAENVVIEKDSISFLLKHKTGESVGVRVQIRGPLLENILLAQLTALEMGVSLRDSSEALNSFVGGLEVKTGINGAHIINSSYSANPTGAVSDMEYMKLWDGKKIVVMPSLIELGSSSKEVHRRIGEKIAEIADIAIITTKDRFKEIVEGAVAKGMKKDAIILQEHPVKIMNIIKDIVGDKDVILLEGRVPPGLVKIL